MVSLTQNSLARYCKDAGHLLENCLWLQAREQFLANQDKAKGRVKLKAPASQGLGHRGGAKFDPPLTSTCFEDRFESMLKTLPSNAVSSETKQRILKRAVLQCLSITMEFLWSKSSIFVRLRFHGDAHS